jgi:hypothetical protein
VKEVGREGRILLHKIRIFTDLRTNFHFKTHQTYMNGTEHTCLVFPKLAKKGSRKSKLTKE